MSTVISDVDLLVRKVGEGCIILCFCERCLGTNPILIAHGDWLCEKKRMCPKTVGKIMTYVQK